MKKFIKRKLQELKLILPFGNKSVQKGSKTKLVTIAYQKESTERRQEALEKYLSSNVFDGKNFKCKYHKECEKSHTRGRFNEGILHHLGKYYDLIINEKHIRIVVVAQECGGEHKRISLKKRYNTLLECGKYLRFHKDGNHKSRNPHMKGTTLVLRLFFTIISRLIMKENL